MSKTAFENMTRDSVYVGEPITQLRIVGGLVLAENEQGDLDTEKDTSHPLWDKRLYKALTPAFIANVAHRGVNVPITIIKLDDVCTVVVGRRRVRAARVENRIRIAQGNELLLKVKGVIQRDASSLALITARISENAAREDDNFADKLEQVKQILEQGSEEDAARSLCVPITTIRNWLLFDDNATDETKAALKEERLNPSACAELARVKNPDEQRALLATLLAAPDPKARTARGVKAARSGKELATTLNGKRDYKAYLRVLQEQPHGNRSEKTLAWWSGAEEVMKIVAGEEGADQRLIDLIAKIRE